MYGVFSDYLISRYAKRAEDKLKDVLDHMNRLSTSKSQKEYDPVTSDHHVVCISPLTRNEYFTDNKYIYECLTNSHIKLLIRWINKNIVLGIYKNNQLQYYSTNVRIRIASCMLNTLVEKKFVNKEYALLFHEILIANVTDLVNKLLDDELPF